MSCFDEELFQITFFCCLSSRKCSDKSCFVCTSDNKGKERCRASSVTYSIKCRNDACDFIYNGQTGKNGFSRGKEHCDDYRLKRTDSVLWSHCQHQHGRLSQQFSMEVEDVCRDDPTKRQILEAVRIKSTDPAKRMNNKSEWNFVCLPRINIET